MWISPPNGRGTRISFPHLMGAMVVGSILVAFYRVLPRRIARIEEVELQRFIEFKKILAGFLFAYPIFLSGWSFFTWAYDLTPAQTGPYTTPMIFYNDFFTALILVDVLLLVISFRYLSDFGRCSGTAGSSSAPSLLRRAGH